MTTTSTGFFTDFLAKFAGEVVGRSTFDVAHQLLQRMFGGDRAEALLKILELDEHDIWFGGATPDTNQIATRVTRSIPILTIANLKGGVGKTTLAANLGVYFADRGKQVLLIDFDWQGSLTVAVAHQPHLGNAANAPQSKANKLIDGTADAQWILQAAEAVTNVPNLSIIPAFYSFAACENRVMIEWLIRKRQTDIRYRLAHLLHNHAIQERFQLIIIDAPPRFSTAVVNALCASTDLLIPAKLDKISVEAVHTFMTLVQESKIIYPHLNLAGIVGTMKCEAPDLPYKDYEEECIILMKQYCRNNGFSEDRVLEESSIPEKTNLARLIGRRPAIRDSSLKAPFENLALKLEGRLWP